MAQRSVARRSMTGPVLMLLAAGLVMHVVLHIARAQDAPPQPERVLHVDGAAASRRQDLVSNPSLFAVTPSAIYVLRSASGYFSQQLGVYRVRSIGSSPELVLDLGSPSLPPGIASSTDSPVPRVVGDVLLFAYDGGIWRLDPDGPARLVRRFASERVSASDALRHVSEDRAYFVLSTEPHGEELWSTDGTPQNTRPVVPLSPGEPRSFDGFLEFDGATYFQVMASNGKTAWWTSDGRPSGTLEAPDHAFAPDGLTPTVLGRLPGALVAAGWTPQTEGRIWRTDGTRAGTRVLAKLPKLAPFALPIQGQPGGQQVCFATEVPGRARWLWISDGTAAGTRRVGDFESDDYRALPSGAVLYLRDGPDGRHEVWRTDGTDEGDWRVLDLGVRTTELASAAVFQGELILRARGGGDPGSLWALSDGPDSGRRFLPNDEVPAFPEFEVNRRYDSLLAATDRQVWFARSGTHFGYKLTGTDGTPAGTADVLLTPGVRPGIHFVAATGEALYVATEDALLGRQLFRLDDSAGARPVSAPNGFSHAIATGPMSTLGDGVLFVGPDRDTATGEISHHVWRAQGESAVRLAFVVGDDSRVRNDPVTVIGSRGYFREVNAFGSVAWSTDGTRSGTRSLAIPDPVGFAPFGELALVTTFETGRYGLWRSDGHVLSTSRIATFRSIRTSSITTVGDLAFFAAEKDQEGSELWRTDGTVAGTLLEEDLLVGEEASFPFQFLTRDGRLFFTAYAEEPNGTVSQKPFVRVEQGFVLRVTPELQQDPAFRPDTLVTLPNGRLLLRDDADGFPELWRTDGTLEGTVFVHHFEAGSRETPAADALDLGDGRAVFRGADHTHGAEPWITDGTSAGTYRLADLAPGAAGSFPANFRVVGQDLYFTIDPSGEGQPSEVWRYPLTWILPENAPSADAPPRPLDDVLPTPEVLPRPLVLDKLRLRIDLKRLLHDSLRLRFRVPVPEGGVLEGETLRVSIGNIDLNVTLDHRGRGTGVSEEVRVRARPVRAKRGKPGGMKVTVELKRGNFIDPLTGDRLVVPPGEKSVERAILVTVERNGVTYANVAAVRYRSGPRSGRGKLIKGN